MTNLVAAVDSSDKAKIVADYICDGTADQVEIQAAIDALPAVGGVVELSEGNFSLSGPAVLTGKNNIGISGSGLATKLKVVSGSGHLIRCTPADPDWSDNLRLSNLYLDCNELGSYCVIFDRVRNVVLENIFAKSSVQHNIYLYNCENVQLENVIAEYSGDDNIAFGGNSQNFNLNNIIVRNSRGSASGASSGIEIDDSAVNGYHNISNIHAYGNYGAGIEIHAHNGQTMPRVINISNLNSHNNKRGIYIGRAQEEGTYVDVARNINIINAQLHDNTETGLFIRDVDGLNVINAIVKNNAQYGAYIHSKSTNINLVNLISEGLYVNGSGLKDIKILGSKLLGVINTNGIGVGYLDTSIYDGETLVKAYR